jgi:hypothetical protein
LPDVFRFKTLIAFQVLFCSKMPIGQSPWRVTKKTPVLQSSLQAQLIQSSLQAQPPPLKSVNDIQCSLMFALHAGKPCDNLFYHKEYLLSPDEKAAGWFMTQCSCGSGIIKCVTTDAVEEAGPGAVMLRLAQLECLMLTSLALSDSMLARLGSRSTKRSVWQRLGPVNTSVRPDHASVFTRLGPPNVSSNTPRRPMPAWKKIALKAKRDARKKADRAGM